MVKIRKKDGGKNRRGIVPRGKRYVSPLSMLDEFNRTFDDFRNNFEDILWSPFFGNLRFREPRMLSNFSSDDFLREPDIDIVDSGDELILKAELPGISKNDVEVEVTDDSIEIKGEAKKEVEEKGDDDSCYICRERSYSSFHRKLTLPEEIIPDKAEAKMEDGILVVKLKKKEQAKKSETKKIEVK